MPRLAGGSASWTQSACKAPRFPKLLPPPFPLSPAPLAPTFPQVPKAQASPPGDLSEPYTPLIPSVPLHWEQNNMDTDSNTVENDINGVGVAILEELPCLSPQTFGMLKLGKTTFGLGFEQLCVLNHCLQRQSSRLL